MRFIVVFIVLFFLACGAAANHPAAKCNRGVDIMFPVDLTAAQLTSLAAADGGQNFIVVPGTDGNGNLNTHLANVVNNARQIPTIREINVLFSPLASGDVASIKRQFDQLYQHMTEKRIPFSRIYISVTEGRANWPKNPDQNRKTLLEVLQHMETAVNKPTAPRPGAVGIHTAAFYFNKIVGPAAGFNSNKLWYMDTDEKQAIVPKSPLNGNFADWKQDEGYMKQYQLKVNVGGVEVNKNVRSDANSACVAPVPPGVAVPATATAATPTATAPTAAGPSRPVKFRQLKQKVMDAVAQSMLETKGVFMDNSDNRVIMEAQDAKAVPPPARTLAPGLKVEGNWIYVDSNNEQPQQQAQPRFAQAQVQAQAQTQAQTQAEAAAKAAAQAKAKAAAQAKAKVEAAARAKAEATAKAAAQAAAKVNAEMAAKAAAKAAAEAKVQAAAKAEAVARAKVEAEAAAAMRTLLNLETEIGHELVAEIDHEAVVNSVADRDLDYNQMGSLLYDDDLAPVPASNIKPQPVVAQRTAPDTAPAAAPIARSMLESSAQTETEVDVDAETEVEAEADPLAGDVDAKSALHLLTELDLDDLKQN